MNVRLWIWRMAGRICRSVSAVTYSMHTELHLRPKTSVEADVWIKFTIMCFVVGNHQAEEAFRGRKGVFLQCRAVYDALHVSDSWH